jgi:thioredoxin 1
MLIGDDYMNYSSNFDFNKLTVYGHGYLGYGKFKPSENDKRTKIYNTWKEMLRRCYDDNFKKILDESNVPVLIDFWADWCGPCKMIAPVVEEVAAQFEGKVMAGKLNVDANQSVPASLKVISIPTIILFKNGKELDRSIGYKTKDEISNFINNYL